MAAPSPEPAYVLRGHDACVHSLAFAADRDGKEVLLSGDDKGLVKAWDLETHRAHQEFSTGTVGVLGLKVAGLRIYTQTKSGALGIWDWERIGACGEPSLPVSGIKIEFHSFCKFARIVTQSPDTHAPEETVLLAAPGKDGAEIGLWDTRTNEFRTHFRPQTSSGASLKGSPTGMCTAICTAGQGHLLGAYEDGTIRVWDLRSPAAMLANKVHSEPIFGLGAGPLKQGSRSQVSKAACVSGGADAYVAISHLGGLDGPASKENAAPGGGNEADRAGDEAGGGVEMREEGRVDLGGAGAKGVSSISVRDDGKVAAAACWDGRVRLYACRRPQLLASLQCHSKGVQCVEFSSASRLLASASEDTRIAVWDVYR